MARAMQASCRDARPMAFLLSFLLSGLIFPSDSTALDPAYSPAEQAQMEAAKERRRQTAYERINKIIHDTEAGTSGKDVAPLPLMPSYNPAPIPPAARYQPVTPVVPVTPVAPPAPVTPSTAASVPLPAQSVSPSSPFYIPPATAPAARMEKTNIPTVAALPPPPTSLQSVTPPAPPTPMPPVDTLQPPPYSATAKPLEFAPVVSHKDVSLPPPAADWKEMDGSKKKQASKEQPPKEGVVADKTYVLTPGAPLPATATTPPSVPAAETDLAEPPSVAAEQLLPEVVAAIAETTPPEAPDLSPETEEILSGIPAEIIGRPKSKEIPDNFNMNRVDPATGLSATKGEEGAVETTSASETLGMNVAVKQRPVDVDYELEKAYVALVGGNPDEAIGIYKEVLDIDPNNTSALFGLATTYHRVGLLDEARPIYGKLLKLEPRNKDAINNFLVLVGEEAPERALTHMEHLESQNPEFAPIPAQMALLYTKLGNTQEAIKSMQRAVNLSPENLVYKYNLAILYDKAEKPVEASILYKQLLEARFRGETIPADADQIQQRLTFLLSNG